MAGRNPRRVAHTVIEALRRAQLRGILATGLGALTADALPESVFLLDQAPHDWLFPRMAVVVHNVVITLDHQFVESRS